MTFLTLFLQRNAGDFSMFSPSHWSLEEININYFKIEPICDFSLWDVKCNSNSQLWPSGTWQTLQMESNDNIRSERVTRVVKWVFLVSFIKASTFDMTNVLGGCYFNPAAKCVCVCVFGLISPSGTVWDWEQQFSFWGILEWIPWNYLSSTCTLAY